jgi:hypothetical protein
MIKKIHLIWVGSFIPMYDKRPYLNRVLKWARLNKGWQVHLWYSSRTLDATGKQQMGMLAKIAPEISLMDCGKESKLFVGLEDSFADELYNKFPNYGAASDILRVAILIKYGGLYFDTDIDPVKPLGSLKPAKGFFINRIGPAYANDILYAEKTKHAFFIKYRDKMLANYAKLTLSDWDKRRTDKEEKNQSTQEVSGPGALWNVLTDLGYLVDGQIAYDTSTDPLVFPKTYIQQDGSDSSWL